MRAIVVGSGAGGATVAKELSANGMKVALLEKGPYIEERDAARNYVTIHSEVGILRTCCVGGTTVVSGGNGVRVLENELRNCGLDLSAAFEQAEHELGVRMLPDSHFGNGTTRFMEAADDLGFAVRKMPKFIDPAKCTSCGKCASGCPYSAKWSAVNFVKQAVQNGATLLANTSVDELLVKKGEVVGVKSNGKVLSADIVVLAAGALETPRLLQAQGLQTTPHLFVDTFVTVGGMLKGIQQNKEVPMNALITCENFMLAPHVSNHLVRKMDERGIKVAPEDVLGVMVKIKDEEIGMVDDTVKKGVTTRDAVRLSEGAAIAGALLEHAGADPATFVSTPLRGAHPGGTARIGTAVDTNLETEVSGLYVADASVLPASPGAPPILTIVALAKHLSDRILAQS